MRQRPLPLALAAVVLLIAAIGSTSSAPTTTLSPAITFLDNAEGEGEGEGEGETVHALCTLLTSRQCDIIIAVRKASSALSFTGCIFIAASIVLFQKYRNFAQRLILWLSIAALLDTIPYFFAKKFPEKNKGCLFQAFWTSYFDWTVLLWVCIITYNLYLNLVKRMDTQLFERRYHVLAWGFPLIPASVPFINSSYGPAGTWCWIETSTTLRFVVWYAPLFILVFVLAVLNTLITLRVRRQTREWQGTYRPEIEEEKVILRKFVQPLRFYPLVYLVCSSFALVNRIQNAAAPSDPVFVLYLLHALSSPLQGFLNAIVFAGTDDFWKLCNPASLKKACRNFARRGKIKEYPLLNEPADTIDTWGTKNDSSDEEDTWSASSRSSSGKKRTPGIL